METLLRFRGREITPKDVEFIRDLVARNPSSSRRSLSEKLCEAWNWRQLHRSGHIELPPPRRINPNPLARRTPPREVSVDTTPIECPLSDLQPLELRQVRRTPEEPLFGGLIEKYHYLRYTQPVGEHLKYIIYSGKRPIACMAWCSAPRHLGLRDRYIGWSREARRKNIHLLAYNTRYLIMPWVRVSCLASHILGRMARLLPQSWEEVYGHPVHFLETFVDPARNRGTCYLAANWTVLGRTSGRGNNAPTHEPRVPVKEILVYPLTRLFRELLGDV
jgi:hypothetical protein